MAAVVGAVALHARYLEAVMRLAEQVRARDPEWWQGLPWWRRWLEPARGLSLWGNAWPVEGDFEAWGLRRVARRRFAASWAAVGAVMGLGALLL